jgi:hypothetical protein
MQYVFLKSGVIIRFNPEKCEFSFNQRGYFAGDVGLMLPGETGYHNVESFTFNMDEISCHWVVK